MLGGNVQHRDLARRRPETGTARPCAAMSHNRSCVRVREHAPGLGAAAVVIAVRRKIKIGGTKKDQVRKSGKRLDRSCTIMQTVFLY